MWTWEIVVDGVSYDFNYCQTTLIDRSRHLNKFLSTVTSPIPGTTTIEKSPYLQDPHAPVPVVRPSIVQKRSWSASQTSLQQQQGSPTGNFGARQLVKPLRLSNVDATEYPHSPVLPTTTTTTSKSSSRISDKFGSQTSHPSSLCAKPPHLLAASATMPILSASGSPTEGFSSSTTMPVISSPVSRIATAGVAGGDWKLAMTPENIRPLENAREVHARLRDCVEELGRLKEMVVVF
jgi:hypothetical protein